MARKRPDPGPMEAPAGNAPGAGGVLRVAVVEPLPCMRAGLLLVLERSGRYRVVLQVADGEALITALEGGTQVDLVLMDVRPPEPTPCTWLCWLRDHRPAVRTLAYGLPADDGAVVRCYRSGAGAMLPKDMDEDLLLFALEVLERAGVFHTPITQRVLLENPEGLSADERRLQKLQAQLTARQLEMLLLVCRADSPSSARIAKELGISARTVESHVDELFELFGVNKRTLLVRAAIRLGLVQV